VTYALGVDLGTTYSAAAVARGADAQAVVLGARAAEIPSVVWFAADGSVLVGDEAERQATVDASRVAREFKRRLGDPVPMVVAGVPHPSEELMSLLLRSIIATVIAQQGGPPDRVVLTHPANHSDHKMGLLRAAAAAAGLPVDRVMLLTEPEAAAVAYSRQHRIEVGEVVAIYDFGGGTFDAALVRRTADRFELTGVPEGLERLGGIDIDQAILAKVDSDLGGVLSGADRSQPAVQQALNQVRAECRHAKEALSAQPSALVRVALPSTTVDATVQRADLEAMVRPRIGDSIRALERTVASAGLRIDQVTRILLVGGTSRMPVVGQMVAQATGRPVSLDDHPKLAIAVGAALIGAAVAPPPLAAPPVVPFPPPQIQPAQIPPAQIPPAQIQPEWTAPALSSQPRPVNADTALTSTSRSRNVKIAIGVGAVVALGVVGVVALVGGGSNSKGTLGDVTTVPPATSAPVVTTTPGSTAVTTTVAGVTTTVAATTSAPVLTVPGQGLDATVDLLAFGSTAGSGIPGPAPKAGVKGIVAVATDTAGATYVAAQEGAVLKIAGGQVSNLATVATPGGIAVQSDGTVLVSTPKGVSAIKGGAVSVFVDGASVGIGATPGPLVLDGVGDLYIADNDHHRVIRRGPDGSLSLVAGNGQAASPGGTITDGQQAVTASLGKVVGLAIDLKGDLLIADRGVEIVRSVAHDGTMTTLAGGGSTTPATGVQPRDLSLKGLAGVAVDPTGRWYVTDDEAGALVRSTDGGVVEIVIHRQSTGKVVNGVPASQSSVGTVGALIVNTSGDLQFADDATLRHLPT